MEQHDLDLGGDVPKHGNWQTRDHHGYFQSREGQAGPWRFHVCGFDASPSGQAGRCTVLRSDGSSEWVPIDAADRITIAGRKYGRRHWAH